MAKLMGRTRRPKSKYDKLSTVSGELSPRAEPDAPELYRCDDGLDLPLHVDARPKANPMERKRAASCWSKTAYVGEEDDFL